MREMKDSGIEWIGDIPKNWCIKKVKFCFSIISGSGFTESLQGQENGDLPICKASDISNAGHNLYTSANYLSYEQAVNNGFTIIPKDSILFPKIGESMRKNRRSISRVPCCLDNNCQAIVPYNNIHSDFSYYTMLCIDMLWFDNNGTVPCINNVKFKNSFLPYPPLPEQQKIADYLDCKCAEIDSLVSDIQRQIELLEEYKRSVITEAVTKGLDKNAPMKNSGIEWIGDIPEHWEVEKLKFHLTRCEPRNPGEKQVLSVYREYGVIPKDSRDDNHNVTSEDTSNYKYVIPGNLVINKMKAWQGSMGVSAYEGIVSPAYFIYKFIDDLIFPKYLHHLFRNCYKDEFRRISGGIREGQWDLSPYEFSNLLLLIPPLDEQCKIVEYLEEKCTEIDTIISEKQQQIETIEEYKKSLIFEYVTGKKEVQQ